MIIRFSLPALLLLLATACAASRSPALNWATSDELAQAKRLVDSGSLRQAVDELSMLLELNPKNHEARWLRAVAYQNLEQFGEAIEDYETLLKNDYGSARTHYNLGMIYAFKRNEREKALRHFDQFLSLSPDHSKARAVARIVGSLDGAGTLPADSNADLAALAGIADPAERRERLLELAERNPDSPVLQYLIGKTYEDEGNDDAAIRAYQTALRNRPSCGICHEALGRILIRKKRGEEGRLHLRKAELYGSSPEPEEGLSIEASGISGDDSADGGVGGGSDGGVGSAGGGGSAD